MASFRQTSQINCNHDPRSRKRSRHLSSTIEKLARAGEQAGFRVEEMIEMLKAGARIGSLLDMISYSLSHEALDFTQQRQGESISASAPLPIALEEHPWDA
jgi:hypothetical protein